MNPRVPLSCPENNEEGRVPMSSTGKIPFGLVSPSDERIGVCRKFSPKMSVRTLKSLFSTFGWKYDLLTSANKILMFKMV